MLTPEYLEHCTDYLLGLYDELDRAIVRDIARRIVKTGGVSPTAQWQIDRAQHSGMLLSDVTEQVARTNAVSEQEIATMFEEAGIIGMENDAKPLILAGQEVNRTLSPAMREALNAAIEKTCWDVQNLTMTTGSTAQNAYMEAINKAYMKIQSGAFSYNQAVRDAVREAAKDGNWVYYLATGHRSRLDVAIRRAVRTGINQTAGVLTEMYSEDMGVEYYETTAHAGARPSHAEWQGRVFKIIGADQNHPNFRDATGYGTGPGLCGWNCRHSFYPFWPGISQPAYTKGILKWYDSPRYEYEGNRYTEYEISQMMRAHERSIRETKRVLAGEQAAMEATDNAELRAEMQADFDAASAKLKRQEAEYKDLCRKTKHRPDSERTAVVATLDRRGKIVSFSRSTAQRARRSYERQMKAEKAG